MRKADSVTLMTTDRRVTQQRLDGWKSIARYLARTCRTVQRWQAEYGLPVHRLGGDKGPIFAYAKELDDWMRNRGRHLTADPAETAGPVLLHTPQAHEEPVFRNEVPDHSLTPGPGKARAEELVTLAQRMWVTLSSNNIRLIARLFREAVDLDPFNIEAWVGLSQTLLVEGLLGKLRVTVAYPAAKAALDRALEIDAGRREAKCLTAWYQMLSTREWQGARQGFEEALMHRPRTSRALVGRSLLHAAEGRLQDASGVLKEALKQYPFSFPAKAFHCWIEYLRGEHAHVLNQVAEAKSSGEFGRLFNAVEALASIQIEPPKAHIERLEAMVADSPQHDVLKGALGYAYAAAAQEQRAREILEDLTRFDAHEKENEPYAIALVLIGLNQRQEAVKRLEQCYREGSLWSLGFHSEPILASLRSDPHYLLFMSRASYPAACEVPGGLFAS